MATFSSDNFIMPVDGNTNFSIRDKNDKERYSIYFNNGSVFYRENNYVIIKINYDDYPIYLDFKDKKEAIIALSKLKKAYSKTSKNYSKESSINVNLEKKVFNSDNGNINNNQTTFHINEAERIFDVLINGVSIIGGYDFDYSNKNINIDTNELTYSLDTEDEVIIKYFSS